MDTLNSKRHHRYLKAMLAIGICSSFPMLKANAVPSLTIPQVPLILTTPSHPQVFIAIGNSQSMDGTLSGAIMTGSGSLSTALSSLSSSSSPSTYLVPSGFTPPVQAANAFGYAPYTVSVGGKLIDNGPSRLNVAKAGVQAIISNYLQTTDFALGTYNTGGASTYATWVYYMSPTGAGFTFTNIPIAGNRYVTNPCFGYLLASATIKSNCTSMAALYGSVPLSTSLYMQIGASSDDPSINDVLYANGLPGVYVTYNGPNPASPFPPNFSLANYNAGGILVGYNSSSPNIGGFSTSPTNAGYVPFSPQVMYAARGFGYYGTQTANSGKVVVPMTTAGVSPTASTIATAINAFTPYLQPETNNSATTEIKDVATQAPTAGLLKQANTYLTGLASTASNGCPQKKYVILISDGLPTQDLNGKLWPPLGSASAAGYGVTATFNADGSLNTTNDQAVIDTINTIKTLKTNGIPTYIIGLGAGVDSSINPQAAQTLTAMAVAAGTGNYYPATDPTSLVNDLNTILISIQNGTFSTSAAAISSSHLSGSSVEYQASFVSSDDPYLDWTGDLAAIALNPTTGVPTSAVLWSAQAVLDSLVSGTGWSTARLIATWNPTAGDGVPFRWSSLSASQQLLLQPSILQPFGILRLNYLRGDQSLEKHNGGIFRDRTHILGDIIDSQVNYVGVPNAPILTTSYINFAKAQASRPPVLYVGANDGMLHAFTTVTGTELFAFIPNGVFSNLIDLTDPVYNQSHLFYVNGSPTTGDVQFNDNSWRTLLVAGLNGGGNSVYALDITYPNNLSDETALANAVLWEFTDGDMGLTYSQPQIGQIGLNSTSPLTFAVFFGNGYNSPTNKAVFYALDPKTGTVLKKIDLCAAVSGACNALLPNGLSTLATAQKDGLQGQPITVVYGGDLQGNLWAIDVNNTNPSAWSARLLFKAKDSVGTFQPITTTPVITLNPNYPRRQGLFVMFGTGRLLTSADLLDTQTQTIYGVWDKPLAGTTFTRSNLQVQNLSLVAPAASGFTNSILTVTSNTINWNTYVGWYDDLPTAGQRVITNPTIINGSFITTLNAPPVTVCDGAFTSMLLELNYQSGGSFLKAILDVNGDGAFTDADKYGGNYAVGVSLSKSYGTAPNILFPTQGNNILILITQSNGAQSTILNPNNNPRKVGWWQIQ